MSKFEKVYSNIISEARLSRVFVLNRLWSVIWSQHIQKQFQDQITGLNVRRLTEIQSLVKNISQKEYNEKEIAEQIVDALRNVCKLK